MARGTALVCGVLAAVGLAACGGGSKTTTAGAPGVTVTIPAAGSASVSSASSASAASAPAKPKPKPPAYPQLAPAATGALPTGFAPAVRWRGQTAAWVARSASGAALLAFNQGVVTLNLHSGTIDAGATGWRFGPLVAGAERRQLVAAFNGAFKFNTDAGGFESYGRVAVPLQAGRGSIVTYADGHTDIGSWRGEVPTGQPIASVRQNLTLLIDHGTPASTLNCLSCWGATLGGVSAPARSALGITADGRLIWAGGEHLTVGSLADALLGARVVRAVELDINPEWVAAYVYGHRGGAGPLAPVPIVPGQPGVPGQFLTPYSRDFFTITGR